MRRLGNKTKKMLTMEMMHHPKADVHILFGKSRRKKRTGLTN